MKIKTSLLFLFLIVAGISVNASNMPNINNIPLDSCEEVIVPSSFTPNGDGVNDVLQIICKCAVSFQYSVFDRWGDTVFEAKSINITWDGTNKGVDASSGVYLISYSGVYYSGVEFEGELFITLLR